MSRIVHVHPEPPRRVADLVEVAATFTWPPMWPRFWRLRRQRTFIRVPAELDPSEHAVGDAMLLASLFPAMRRARTLRLHAKVSADLLASATRLRDLGVSRRPDKFGPIEIETDGTVEGEAPTGPVVLPFSAGLDSSWSMVQMTNPPPAQDERKLGLAFMILGADIPIDAREAFERAFARSQRIADACGVPLRCVETNLRAMQQNWTLSSNTALGAILTLFRERYGLGRIAVGYSAAEAPRWSPADATDPALLSCRAFPIEGHGYEIDRPGKLEAVLGFAAVVRGLRVCYRPGVYDRNCGDCLKCLTVMLFAKALTGASLPCFPRDVVEADVRAVAAGPDSHVWIRLAQFVRVARARGQATRLADVAVEELERAGRGLDGELK